MDYNWYNNGIFRKNFELSATYLEDNINTNLQHMTLKM